MKKLTAIGKVRAALRTARQELVITEAALLEKKKEADNLRTQLMEARRRTIPMGNGELNFLPLYIERFETKTDLGEAMYDQNFPVAFVSSRRCVLTVLASMEPGHEPMIFSGKK